MNKIQVLVVVFLSFFTGVGMSMYTKETAHAIVEGLKKSDASVVDTLWSAHSEKSIDLFFDKCFFDAVAQDPQILTDLGIFEVLAIRGHNAFLTPVTPEHFQRIIKNAEDNLCILKTYDYADLTPRQQVTYKFLAWELEHISIGAQFYAHVYIVNQMFGVIFDINHLLTAKHVITCSEDVQNYCARLRAIPQVLQHVQEFMNLQSKKGVRLPNFALKKVISIVQKLLPDDVQKHSFYQYLKKHEKLVDAATLLAVEDLLKAIIYPAYRALQNQCSDMLSECGDNCGVWALPDGDVYYTYMLKCHTTTDLTADEIHAIGIAEVQKIQDEIRALLAHEGIVDVSKSVVELLHGIENDPRFYYPETDEGRQQCLRDFEVILERCRKELYPLFDIKPRAPVIMHIVPEHEAEGAPGAYYSLPSADGSRPGMFYVNLRSMAEMPKHGMETLAVHEAEPGHHFQISVQQEADLPFVRKFLKGDFYNAYVEGWALYVEKLAYEQNFYSSNWSKIGHLQDELMRAARLVVDTGIHSKRWTREQAIEYMVRELGMHYDSVVTEVERYFVLPGQACSYKIGQLKILELRQRAKDALGEKFDIRDFHNIVLNLGAAPLMVLEEVVDQYIQQKK